MQVENQFKESALSAGIALTGEIIANGKLHRCHIDGHKPGTKNGAYILHVDGVPAGWAMDYKTGCVFKWRLGGKPGKPSKSGWQVIEATKKQRQAELDEVHLQAAIKARSIWFKAGYAEANNPYCLRKKIQPHGAKAQFKGVLVVPLFNSVGDLVCVQFIKPDGTKRFLTGGQKKGCFWALGEPTDTILIAEGFATAASLFENQGLQTIVAFDSGNLVAVAEAIRAKHPSAEIIICGDNDESGAGQKSARSAALAVGGKMLIPPVVGMDWNDYLTMGVTE